MMVEHILVPTDGSENSHQVIDMAIHLAQALGAQIHAISIASEYASGDQKDQLRSDPTDAANAAVEEARSRVKSANIPFSSSIRQGIADQEIVAHAEENDIDMIVMGTHGRSGIQRVVLGSVAEKTLRNSPVPVLTVPPETQ